MQAKSNKDNNKKKTSNLPVPKKVRMNLTEDKR